MESKVDLQQIARTIALDKPIAARKWVAKIKQKCHLLGEHPELGDDRSELGERIRSSYIGSAVRKSLGFCCDLIQRNLEFCVEIIRRLETSLGVPTQRFRVVQFGG